MKCSTRRGKQRIDCAMRQAARARIGEAPEVRNKRIEPRLRAEFREAARDIVNRDRSARKYGMSQNTIGEIERAMVRAFQLGEELGGATYASPRPAHHGIDWEEVRPRGREVLMDLTFRSGGFDVVDPIGLRCVEMNGRERWATVYADGRQSDRTVAAGSVNPLVKAGLLEKCDDGLLALTPKGRATCEAYWRRRAVEDPSLPKESLRP